MSTNPDINRLSLEERIKRLETRLPVGGSGVGSLSSLYLNPLVVDQCKNNAITDIGEGLVWRIEVDSTRAQPVIPTGQNNIGDWNIKIATLMPKINGMYMLPTHTLMRWQLRSTFSSITSRNALGCTIRIPFFDDSVGQDLLVKKFFYHNVQGARYTQVLCSNALVCPFLTSQGSPGIWASCYATYYFDAYQTASPPAYLGITCMPNNTSTYIFPSAYPSVAFGSQPVRDVSPAAFGRASAWEYCTVGYTTGAESYAGATVAQPQNLPDFLKPIYPPSWYA